QTRVFRANALPLDLRCMERKSRRILPGFIATRHAIESSLVTLDGRLLFLAFSMETKTTSANRAHFERLVAELKSLEDRLREGGAPERVIREHQKGKLTARERIRILFDEDSDFVEIGLLVAYDRHNGQAPAAGVVTGLGRIAGREACVMAND